MFKNNISSDSIWPLKGLSSGPQGPSIDSPLTQPPRGQTHSKDFPPNTRVWGSNIADSPN